MIYVHFRSIFLKHIFLTKNLTFYRNIRNVNRRGGGPKFVEAHVKTVTNFEKNTRITSFDDFARDIKKSKMGDELDVEKALLEEDDFGRAMEKCDYYYDQHLSEEKSLKRKVKKLIVEKKYFKLEKETNLLTHAAKEQIRFLHKSNPVEWNYKTIAECFPISEAGVKKLLKSSFVQTCPEKIKAHDEDVARKWEILKSDKFTTLIAPKTQQLYKEGKLVDDYFTGNPNLPTVPPAKKIVQFEKKQNAGEFSAIVKTYVDYKKHKLLESGKENCAESKESLKQNNILGSSIKAADKHFRKLKYAKEDLDSENSEIFLPPKKYTTDDTDIPLSQFKEILQEERKFISKKKNYLSQEVLEATIGEQDKTEQSTSVSIDSRMACNAHENCFVKIPKYNKHNIDGLMHDKGKYINVYKYDEKLGYQHPHGKIIQGNIFVSPKNHKTGKSYKIKQSIYDSDGEFLYNLPS